MSRRHAAGAHATRAAADDEEIVVVFDHADFSITSTPLARARIKRRGDADEQPVLDDAGISDSAAASLAALAMAAETAIVDVIAAVGVEGRVVPHAQGGRDHRGAASWRASAMRPRWSRGRNCTTSTGNGNLPSFSTSLESSAMTIIFFADDGHDLLAHNARRRRP